MAHVPSPTTLPHKDLLDLKDQVKKHVKALNDSGKLDDHPDKMSAATIMKVLGVESTDHFRAADAWLCSCDTNTK
jgi:hypothetical protein